MIWKLAGMVGLDPTPYTLRELWWMAHGSWQQTAAILATLANAHRDQKKHPRAVQPADCNPLEPKRPRGIMLTSRNIRMLRALCKQGE